ncbi:hypothetical protein M0802_012495 [Mischocyttarus mexicanus]|nr:hypothetical protein M0802_012518 [Mischocyttarus mexicanus]KAI4486195.1 hypothetical protein M0802_012495 [Mischocyttarus mexicanus]
MGWSEKKIRMRVSLSICRRSSGIPLTLHGGRPSSRSSQRSGGGGSLSCAFTRRPSSGGSRGPLVPASRAGAARAAAILLISCHLQATKGGNKHRRTLSDVAEGSSDGLVFSLQNYKFNQPHTYSTNFQAYFPHPKNIRVLDEYKFQVPTTSESPETMNTTIPTTNVIVNSSRKIDVQSATTPTTTSIFDSNVAPRASVDIFQV